MCPGLWWSCMQVLLSGTMSSDEEPSSTVARPEDDTASLGWMFLRRTAAVIGIYAVGYLGLSPAWLLGGIILSVMREKWRRKNKNKLAMARAIALSSEQVTLAKLQDLPSWVHFPDVERAEWLNKVSKGGMGSVVERNGGRRVKSV